MVSYWQCLVHFNTLRTKQNGRHLPDHILKWIFLNENLWIAINISLNFVPRGPISNIPALVQIMAWRLPGEKSLSESMMVSLLTHICVTRPQWVKPGVYHCRMCVAFTDASFINIHLAQCKWLSLITSTYHRVKPKSWAVIAWIHVPYQWLCVRRTICSLHKASVLHTFWIIRCMYRTVQMVAFISSCWPIVLLCSVSKVI